MSAAVTDKIPCPDLAEIVMTLPVVCMNSEEVVSELKGEALTLACAVEIIVTHLSVTSGTWLIGISVGVVYIGRFTVPIHPVREFFAQHIKSRGNIGLVLRIEGVAQVDPSGFAAVGNLAEFAADRSYFDACPFWNGSAGRGTRRGIVDSEIPQRGVFSLFINKRSQCVGIAHSCRTDIVPHTECHYA